MYKTPLIAIVALSCAIPALSQVVQVEDVINIASAIHRVLPNGGIAPGSRFLIKGRNLGPNQMARATGYPLPTSLGGTSVRVRATGSSGWTSCLLLRAAASEIMALLPNNAPVGPAELEVSVNGQAGRTLAFTIAERSFGIFTRSEDGLGPAVARSDRTNDFVHAFDAARPGDVITLLGTGLGAVDGDESRAPVTGNFAVSPEVYVGGRLMELRSAGRSPDSPGVDHVVFPLPADVANGCYVSIVVKHGGVVSNFASLPIAGNPGPCSDANGASAAELANGLSSQDGFYNWGVIRLTRRTVTIADGNRTAQGTADEGAASFRGAELSNASALPVPLQLPSPGSCSMQTRPAQGESELAEILRRALLDASTPMTLPGANVRLTPLDVPLEVGPFLALSGPDGDRQIRVSGQSYSARLGGNDPGQPAASLYLEPGRYTVRAQGGFQLGGFTAEIALAPGFASDAGDPRSPLADNPTITWSGGDPNGTVTISGLALSAGNAGTAMVALFHCVEKAQEGRFTIPETVLSSLRISPTAGAAGLMNVIGSSTPVRLTARGLHTGLLIHDQAAMQVKTFHAAQ